jgi:hypothetical protein
LTKIILKKTTSAIFLAIVLIVGTFAAISPSFMIVANAQQYGMDQRYNSYEPDYGMDNSYDDKQSYEKENSYYKSKDSSIVKCNNINVNGLGNNALQPALNGLATDETQAAEEGEVGASSIGSDGGRSSGSDTDFRVVCIYNNNFNVNEGGTTPEPPDGEVPSPEDFATLQIAKNIPCVTTGPGQEDVCSAISAAITPNLFDITVSGNNNPRPSNFEGTSTQTEVTIGPGNYQISETADSSVNTLISELETNLRADISGPQSIFNGACNKQGNDFATGTIAEGETQACTINNAFTVVSITGPPVDTQPPNVLSFIAEPFRVIFSSGGTITITAHVTDATGVQRVGVFIQDECGGSPGFFRSFELTRVSGTATDGIYQATFTFPESALNVNHFCNPNLAFQIGGIVSDTLGNGRGLQLIGVILDP